MSIRIPVRQAAAIFVLGIGALAAVASAHAETRWEAAHPRRDQVLDRTQHLNRRIVQERREGQIGVARAHALHAQVRQVRREEQAMARSNGGYITKAQQAALNQQENIIGRTVGP